MRAIFTIVLLLLVSGLVIATHAADAPTAGIDYAIEQPKPMTCKGEDIPGDGLLSRLSGVAASPSESADIPDTGVKAVYHRLTCLVMGY